LTADKVYIVTIQASTNEVLAKILYDESWHSTDMAPKKYRQKVKQQKQSQAAPHEAHHHHKKGKDRRSLYFSIAVVAIVVIVIGAIAASGLTGNNGSTNPTASPSPSTSPTQDSSYVNSTYVFFHTSMGNFTVQLRNDMPITTGNFLKLVREGVYNGSTFHRVIENFMVQGGIPANGQSVSSIQDEFTSTNHNYYGTIAMANTGHLNSGSNQFFINTVDNTNRYASFDSTYVAFGKVVYGMENVVSISHVSVDSNDKPLQDVTIIGASVLNT
jgi:peptidylprolyl isomerase